MGDVVFVGRSSLMACREFTNVQHLHHLHVLVFLFEVFIGEEEVPAGSGRKGCTGNGCDRTDQVVLQAAVAIAFADLVVAVLAVGQFAVLSDARFDFLIDVSVQQGRALIVRRGEGRFRNRRWLRTVPEEFTGRGREGRYRCGRRGYAIRREETGAALEEIAPSRGFWGRDGMKRELLVECRLLVSIMKRGN